MRQLYRFEEGFDVYFTSAAEGDARELTSNGITLNNIDEIVGGRINLLRVNQVHSSVVRSADEILEVGIGKTLDGDAIVAKSSAVALGVFVADCAPVALASSEGVFACVHAGWRGIYEGVLESTVAKMVEMGATCISAFVGPCIKYECYEFLGSEVDELVTRFGPSVVGRTSWGTQSLNIVATIEKLLLNQGIKNVSNSNDCTACGDGYFSYRARGDSGRHLMAIVPNKSVA